MCVNENIRSRCSVIIAFEESDLTLSEQLDSEMLDTQTKWKHPSDNILLKFNLFLLIHIYIFFIFKKKKKERDKLEILTQGSLTSFFLGFQQQLDQ